MAIQSVVDITNRILWLNVASTMHASEVRSRKDKPGVDLISDALPFGRLLYGEANAVGNAISCAKFYSRSHDAVIRRLRWSWQHD